MSNLMRSLILGVIIFQSGALIFQCVVIHDIKELCPKPVKWEFLPSEKQKPAMLAPYDTVSAVKI